jgi:hypothetical protein
MVTRPNQGKLPGHIPEPQFVADPNHRKKVFTGDLWKLFGKPVTQRFTLTKMDIARLGTGYGFMIWSLQKKPKEEWTNAAKAVLENHFDNHQYCGNWCSRKRQTVQQRQQSARYYRSLTKDERLYEELNKIYSRFMMMERLEEVGYGYDTQINKSFNNKASWFAPKNKVYCGSQSLKNRLSIAIGINSIGTEHYFKRLFHALGMAMPECVNHFLAIKQVI